MELDHKVTHSEHISYEDMERLSSLNSEELSDTDLDWVQKMDEIIDSCGICRRRYMFFVNTQATFASFSSVKQSLSEKTVLYFQEFLLQTDRALREKLSVWLESSQSFMSDLNQMTLRPAAVGGTRGLENGEDTANLEAETTIAGDDAGFFAFELKKEAELSFSIKKETINGQPVCLAIFGREGTDFSQLYSLTPFGKNHLRAKTPQALPAGKYVLCVPTLRTTE
jgi:hypothetical protein